MFHVYLLQSEKDGSFYTGYTADLRKRMVEHANGATRTTAKNGPWKIVYFESCLNRDDALRRERYLKTSQGQMFMKLRLREYLRSHRS